MILNTVMSRGSTALVAAAILVVGVLAFLGIARAASVSDLTVGSATVAPGSAVTINITATVDELGSYRVDVYYDSSLVTATECAAADGVCSINVVASDTVSINGSNLSGITGSDVVLGTITFLAGGSEGTSDLIVNPATLVLSDTVGDQLFVTPIDGSITIDASAPTPTPGSSPSPPPPPCLSSLCVGSATVAPGAFVTINISANVTDLGAYRVDVYYDSSLVSATACTSSDGACSIDLVAADTVRMNGSNLAGVTGTNVVLSTITFLAGPTGGTAALTVNPTTLVVADTVGDLLVVTPTNGAITIQTSGSVSEPNPAACEKSMARGRADAEAKGHANAHSVVYCPATPVPTPPPTTTFTSTPTSTPSATPSAGESVLWGDNNCSQQVDPVDSLFVLRGDAALPTDTGDCPPMGANIEVLDASPHIWGDVDCRDGMTPVDSLKILRHDAGLSASQEQPCPAMGASVTIVEG